jgi:hypothetical protein
MKKLLAFFGLPVFVILFTTSSCTRGTINEPADPAVNTETNNKITRSSIPGDTLVTTVARVKEIEGGLEILFNERQALYIINSGHPRYEEISKTARQALATGKPVKLTSAQPGILTNLAWPSSGEITAYLEWYKKNLVGVDTVRKLKLAGIDTMTFSLANNQKWKAFNICFAFPDLAAAQTIFNFCKQQMCTTGPTQITPCIPFAYVRDGCFARAHKMRYIIESVFGYCSQKVFSFGNLDVNASLWGGCCVSWGYHVAPLIRVKINGQYVCYVIDPGMFTGPVPLATWLSAQENTTCDATSEVTHYSIQPSSAYTPTGATTNITYTTDPNYTATDFDLILHNLFGPTCRN